MTEVETLGAVARGSSSSKAWLRALELTAPIARNRDRIFPAIVDERAAAAPEAPALLSARECLSYGALAKRVDQYARWALDQSLAKGDTVCLLMPNRPEYIAVWLGVTKVGAVVALLNTNLTGKSLAHCIDVAGPKHIIVDAKLLDALDSALAELRGGAKVWVHGSHPGALPRIDQHINQHSQEPLRETERRQVTIADLALYIDRKSVV